MVIAHGILCLVGFLFFLPLGALIARYLRTSSSAWFKAHQTIQFFVAGPIVIAGWGLGVGIIANGGGPHFNSTHTVRRKVVMCSLCLRLNRLLSALGS